MTARQVFTSGQVFTAEQANALAESAIAVNAQASSTAYTLVASDAGKLVTFTGGSATITIPADVLAVGDQVNVAQLGTNQITFGTASGVTLVSDGTARKTKGQYAVATCVQYTTNEWLLLGNIKA